MNVELLKELTEAHGVPGQEDKIRAIVNRELKSICDVSVDPMGNVICLKKGKKGDKKLMLAAHMDEIGFVVKYIDDKGFLRVHPVGGWDPRMMSAQRVFVHTKTEVRNGLMMAGTKPKHLLSAAEAGQAPKHDDYFVDTGLSGEEAKKQIRIGDMVTMNRTFQTMGDLFTCKSMDDRCALFVMIEAVKAAKSHDVDVYAVATVQEEIGLRGATAAGSGILPDICVALDVTLANDFPGIPAEYCVTTLGEGTAIKVMDSSLICNPKMVDHFESLAKKHKIKYQLELLTAGGTDAGGVQRQNGGIPSFTLSIPTRYIHTVNETVHKDDVQASIDLLARYIEDAHKGEYGWSLE
ncbi:MAG: M42 family metallopeptidase [Fimbriimonadaceae bacterium]|nr:MAG: M42 family metallopeptidase [Fimbriimonadaceae bacterium]